jgi:hypothetical protein
MPQVTWIKEDFPDSFKFADYLTGSVLYVS